MDKELVERIRKSLTMMADTLNDINDYLTQLRKQTDEEIATLARRTLAAQATAGVFTAPAVEPALDPRRPYTAGRQPRRDGDSFGRVPKTQGGVDGKTESVEQQQRRAQPARKET